jgi:hypothetical protein
VWLSQHQLVVTADQLVWTTSRVVAWRQSEWGGATGKVVLAELVRERIREEGGMGRYGMKVA